MTRFEYEGRFEDADLVRKVSPIGWRHVNLYGIHRFRHPLSGSYVEETLSFLESDRSWLAGAKKLES
jgi:hypothetical protein